MKLTVVIVNYNVKYYVDQCLRSLQKALKDIEADIYIVDNHSKDGSVEYIRERFPYVQLIDSNRNLGFARANNIAIRDCESEYVLLLNPDTIVAENTIRESLEFMDQHPDAGGLGVKMLKADGSKALESRRGLPSPLTALYKISGLCNRYPKSRRFGKYYMGYLSWDEPAEIEVISGAYCLLRHSALDDIGLLDEDFFMYGEDIDLSYRLIKGGYKNWYLPSPILHYKGESTIKSSFRYVHVFYNAMLIFFRKHYGHLSVLVSLPIKMAIYSKATVEIVKMLPHLIRKSLGLANRKRDEIPNFLFVGSESMLKQCRKIARGKALSATFLSGTEKSLPRGHQDKLSEFDPSKNTFVVYDTDSFSYDAIFRYFSENPNDKVRIGTYYPSMRLIITDREIIK